MNRPPLYDRLLELARTDTLRMHMPGHKGKGVNSAFDEVFAIDYTEVSTTGNLYGSGGVIQQAEELCAKYYGMEACFFLTCGATQGLKAAVLAVAGYGGRVLLDRNCHKSLLDACGALNIDPDFVYPEYDGATGVPVRIDPKLFGDRLDETGACMAVVTAPTYYGTMPDVNALVEVCRRRGVFLLIDSAHGAHLRCCGIDDPAMLGADGVVFSAHKTLPAMTQGGYLLMSGKVNHDAVRRATAFFGTTSPSYPIMASLDYSRFYMETHSEDYKRAAQLAMHSVDEIVKQTSFTTIKSYDPCRMYICTQSRGMDGYEAGERLRQCGVEPEMCDSSGVVLITTALDYPVDFERVTAAFCRLEQAKTVSSIKPLHTLKMPVPKRGISLPAAVFSQRKSVKLINAAGETAAEAIAPYPPGVAVIVPGEVIDNFCIEYLLEKRYNKSDEILCINTDLP